MSKSQAERKRDERVRRKALGLVRIEFWLRPELAKKLKQYAARIMRSP